MKRIQLLLFALLLCFSVGTGFAQDRRTFSNPETYVETVLDATTLKALSQEFSIDRVQRNSDGTFDTRIWLSYKDYDNFLAREIPYSIVQPTRANVTMATNYAEMTHGWNRYPTYSTYLAMMDTFQTRYPNLCKIDTILASTPNGHKVLCAHISNNLNDNMGKPSIFYTSTMHGDEVVGYYFMLRLIDTLLSSYNTNTTLTNMVNNFDIWICPLHNPDGTYKTSDNQINTSPTSTRANAHSVDLNRSFPQAGGTVGSGYEPEVSAMMQFFDEHNFTLAANFHGGAEVFNYPWDAWTTSQRAHADDAWWRYVGQNFANTSYLNDENNGITEGGDWYVITGSMQDYHNWFLGTRHATIEVSDDKVLSTNELPNYWGGIYQSLLNFIEEAGNGIHGTVTDSITGEPLLAKVFVNNHDKEEEHSYVETTLPYGDYHRPIKAGTYSVTYSAEGYYSKTITVNVSDGAKLTQNVQLMSTETNSCRKPKYVTVNYDGGTSAVVSWSSSAQSCNIMLNNTQISNVTSPYTLTDLASSTHYDVQVQADCGDGDLSDWTDAVGFTTDCLAQDRCDITFELTDSYGDGWNGAAIQVVDEASNEVLGTFSNTNAAGANETQTYTLSVCNGRAIKFVWVNGSYNSECSYSILDVFGDVIVSGTGAMTTTNYTVDCGLTSCARPNALAVLETTGTTATLSWTENGTANAWQICLNSDETNLINVTTNPCTLTELTAEAAYTAKVRANCGDEQSNWSNVVSFVPSNATVIGSGSSNSQNLPTNNFYKYSLTQQIYTPAELGAAGSILSVAFYKDNTVECNRNLDIYMVSTTKSSFSSGSDWISVSSANKVYSGTVSFADNAWTTIMLNTPFEYDDTRNVAIIVDDNTGSYKSETTFRSFSASSQAIRVYSDGTDYNATLPSSYSGAVESSKNQIRVLIERGSVCEAPSDLLASEVGSNTATLTWTESGEAGEWILQYGTDNGFAAGSYAEMNVNGMPEAALTELTAETQYYARVKAVCGEDNESEWSNVVDFYPTAYVVIGSGSGTNNYLPTNAGYQFSLTQQIYTVEELGEAGRIRSIAFTKSNAAGCSRNLDIYMVSTAKSSFTGSTDWIPVTTSDKVFSGMVDFADNDWTTITLSTPFAYDGEQNVAIVVDDNSGSAGSSAAFRVFPAENQALRVCSRKTNYIATSTSYTGTMESSKNQIRVFIDREPDCSTVLDEMESFETYTESTELWTGAFPSCWTIAHHYTPEPDTVAMIYRSFASDGSYSLRMHHRGIVAMPALSEDVDINHVKLNMMVRQPQSYYKLEVGVMTDLSDESTFELVALCDNPTTAKTGFECNFAGYTVPEEHEGPLYIAFRNIGVSSEDPHSVNYLDAVVLSYYEGESSTCRITGLSHEENFDEATIADDGRLVPSCWTLPAAYSGIAKKNKPQLYTSFAHTGSYSLKMRDFCVYAMPEYAVEGTPITDVKMTFWLRQPQSGYQLEVGVMTNANDPGTFVPVRLVDNASTGMEKVEVSFSGYEVPADAEHFYIAFRNKGRTSEWSYSYNYIDDILLEESAGGGCGITSLPHTEGFETCVSAEDGRWVPACWTLPEEFNSIPTSNKPQQYNSFAHTGSYSLKMRDLCVYAMPEYAVPGIPITDVTMTFWLRQANRAYQLEVGVMTDANDAGTFVPVQLIDNETTGKEEVTVSFADYQKPAGAEHLYIAFRNKGRTSSWTYSYNYIDDIEITAGGSKIAEAADVEVFDTDRYLESIKVYPNPTTGVLHIDAMEVEKVECYNQMGQLAGVYAEPDLDLGNLPKGVYVLRITVPQGVTMRKVVKK